MPLMLAFAAAAGALLAAPDPAAAAWLQRDLLFECRLRRSGWAGAGAHEAAAEAPFAIFFRGSIGEAPGDEPALRTHDPRDLLPLGGFQMVTREWPSRIRVAVAHRQIRGIHMEPVPTPGGGGVFDVLRMDRDSATAQVAVLQYQMPAGRAAPAKVRALHLGHCRIVEGGEASRALGELSR